MTNTEVNIILEKLKEAGERPRPDTPEMYIKALKEYHGFDYL